MMMMAVLMNDDAGEHDLVPGPDPPHELHLPRLPAAGEAEAAAEEAEGHHGEEDHRPRGRHEGVLGLLLAGRLLLQVRISSDYLHVDNRYRYLIPLTTIRLAACSRHEGSSVVVIKHTRNMAR